MEVDDERVGKLLTCVHVYVCVSSCVCVSVVCLCAQRVCVDCMKGDGGVFSEVAS